MESCDREGQFRGLIQEYGIKEFDSGAVAIGFKALLTEWYDPSTQQWMPWEAYDMAVEGDCWIVKKDGKLNDKSVKSLVECAGWDGSFHSIQETTWAPTPCQFSVKPEEREGKTYYKAAFINPFDQVPHGGGFSKLPTEKIKGLDSRFGSALRALAANKMRNQPVPSSSKPPAPPRPSPPPPASTPELKEIPF